MLHMHHMVLHKSRLTHRLHARGLEESMYISGHVSALTLYHNGAKYWTNIVQYLLLVFTIFEVLEGPIHGGKELEMSNCKYRHTEPCKSFSTEIFAGAIIIVVQYLSLLRDINFRTLVLKHIICIYYRKLVLKHIICIYYRKLVLKLTPAAASTPWTSTG
jgi:hypothetical protein